jgi:dihydroorotase
LTGARVHIAHVSAGGSVRLIRQAKEEGVSVTAEVTPHHLTLTEDSVLRGSKKRGPDTDAKVNPPLRTGADVDALIRGLRDGVIDAIATDHAPHTWEDKDRDFRLAAFGISGFETALGCLMGLVHRGDIGLTRLLSRLTCEPARVIGKEGVLGTLEAGATANIAILDLNREWTVDAASLASKGKNTPYHGHSFKGKVMATIASGRMVYIDDVLLPRLTSSCHSERSEESHG